MRRRRRLHKACAKEILNQRKKESIEQYHTLDSTQ